MPNKYITLKEIVASCPFSESQIRRFVKQGKIPFQQPGGKNGKLLFREDALDLTSSAESIASDEQTNNSKLPGRALAWKVNKQKG